MLKLELLQSVEVFAQFTPIYCYYWILKQEFQLCFEINTSENEFWTSGIPIKNPAEISTSCRMIPFVKGSVCQETT